MVKLRSFDAFPKLEDSYTIRGGSDSRPMTYVSLVFLTFFLYLVTSDWMGATPAQKFDVDKRIRDKLQVNFEITVKNPCADIGIYIQDDSDDRLFVNELVQSLQQTFEDGEWCTIGGVFDTNRVKGRLVISPRNPAAAFYGQRPFNTTHVINELSFGDYYPSMLNPLDQTLKVTKDGYSIAYFLSIVPTVYQVFGLTLDTNQYTVTEAEKDTHGTTLIPGIFFEYDFDPIQITIIGNRMPFFAWLCRVVNIIGGVVFAYKLIRRMSNKKKGYRSDRNAMGILDQPISKR